jgi:hypothetical protein
VSASNREQRWRLPAKRLTPGRSILSHVTRWPSGWNVHRQKCDYEDQARIKRDFGDVETSTSPPLCSWLVHGRSPSVINRPADLRTIRRGHHERWISLEKWWYPRLRAEWRYTIEMLLAITGQQALLDQNPLLARSIKNRFPYLDPLNHLQIELLKRHRAGKTDERVVQAIHLSINGIAAGLRNSG